MTAPDINSATSDNSVFLRVKDRPDTLSTYHELVQIIEHEPETGDTTTLRALEIETQWNVTELDQLLDPPEATGYAELIGDLDCQMVVLTSRDEFLDRGRR